jgi:hypothetical protein
VFIKVNGKINSLMEQDSFFFQMVHIMKDSSHMDLPTVKVGILTAKISTMKDKSDTILLREKQSFLTINRNINIRVNG